MFTPDPPAGATELVARPDRPADRARRAIVLEELFREAAASEPVKQAIFRWEEEIRLREKAEILRQPALGGYPRPTGTPDTIVDLLLGLREMHGSPRVATFAGHGELLADHGAAIRRARELWRSPAFLTSVVDVLRDGGFPEPVAAQLAPWLLCEYVEWATSFDGMEIDRKEFETVNDEVGRIRRAADEEPDDDRRLEMHAQGDAVLAEGRFRVLKPPTRRTAFPPCAYLKPCPLRSLGATESGPEPPKRTLGRPVHFSADTTVEDAMNAIAKLGQEPSELIALRRATRWYVDIEVLDLDSRRHIAREIHRKSPHAASPYSDDCGCRSTVKRGIRTVKRLLGLTRLTKVSGSV